MDRPLVAVVMAGGVGTRLYPASRSDRPKQFHTFGGDRSLLSRTVARTAFADETYVVTREEFAGAVRDHAPEVGVLVEPQPKDTGPALVYAAARLREQVGKCILLCLPSDHHVGEGFAATAQRACEVAATTGGLVAIGVEPTRAAVEYGYVKPGTDHGDYRGVERFYEKPDPGAAERYRQHGYLWNAGIFAWAPEALLDAAHNSELAPLVEALYADEPEQGFRSVDHVSIDYAVMEGADDAYVLPAEFEWDDLGSWDALERILEVDDDGNAVLGDALTLDARDCVIAAKDAHVSTVGVEDLVIATYDDRVLVVSKDDAQRVREVVDRLREAGRF